MNRRLEEADVLTDAEVARPPARTQLSRNRPLSATEYVKRYKGAHVECLGTGSTRIPKAGMIVPEMGMTFKHKARQTQLSGLGGVLFTPVQQRVLGLLFGQPDRRFQSGELIRLAASGTGAVHRLLIRLADAGLITVERVGNQKHYRANQASPVFMELHGLIVKTSGLLAPLHAALGALADRIHAAFVYGSVAKSTEQAASDIDLMVIADNLDYAEVFSALQSVEAQLGRTINPNLMSLHEWQRKRKRTGFVSRIADQPRLFVIGSDDDLA